MSVAIYHKKLDIAKVSINPSAKQSSANPSKRAYVNYEPRGPVIISTPKMRIPFGVSEYDPAKFGGQGDIRRYFEASLEGLPEFEQFFQDFDDLVWQETLKNQEQWLGKKGRGRLQDIDAIRGMTVTPTVREDKSGKGYASTLRFKITKAYDNQVSDKKHNKEYDIMVFDKSRKEIPLESIPSGCEARFVIQCTGLVITGGKVHPGWKCCQVMVYDTPRAKLGHNPAFICSDEDDEDDASIDDGDVEEQNNTDALGKALDDLKDDPKEDPKDDSPVKLQESSDTDEDSEDESECDESDDSEYEDEAPPKRGRPRKK